VTEEVVRAEIRKVAGAKKTDLAPDRVRSLSGPLRDVEKGLLWAMIHAPGDVIPVLGLLEDADFEGLRAQSVLEKARALQAVPAEEFPGALMERLSEQEAQLLARVATEREPLQLVPENCVQTLRSSRIERELGDIQQRIDQMRTRPDDGAMNRLLRRKNDLRTQLDLAQRSAKRYV
jgi:hypothetical protein